MTCLEASGKVHKLCDVCKPLFFGLDRFTDRSGVAVMAVVLVHVLPKDIDVLLRESAMPLVDEFELSGV